MTPQIFLVQNDEVIVLTLSIVIRMTLALSVNVIELPENNRVTSLDISCSEQ